MLIIFNRIYSFSIPGEESATSITGDKPLWLDVEEDQLDEALRFCKEQTLNDKKNELVLLYDKDLPKDIIERLVELKYSRASGGFGWKYILPSEAFVGGECDTVVYVGAGDLEAFSRAKLKLMIITVFSDRSSSVYKCNFYNYQKKLQDALEKGLLRTREEIADNDLDDDSTSQITSSLDQSVHIPELHLLPQNQDQAWISSSIHSLKKIWRTLISQHTFKAMMILLAMLIVVGIISFAILKTTPTSLMLPNATTSTTHSTTPSTTTTEIKMPKNVTKKGRDYQTYIFMTLI